METISFGFILIFFSSFSRFARYRLTVDPQLCPCRAELFPVVIAVCAVIAVCVVIVLFLYDDKKLLQAK